MTTPNDYNSFLSSVSAIPEFKTLFETETDRGCALLAAAILDYELSLLLGNSFIDNNRINRKIFSPNGPLGTFSAKIDISYLLGHLPKDGFNKMHIIRNIRNEFGHSAIALNFDVPSISQKIKTMALSINSALATNRELFIRVVNKLLIQIHTASLLVHKASEPEVIDFDAQKIIEKAAEVKISRTKENGN